MSLFSDLEQQAIKSVLGGNSKQSVKTATKASKPRTNSKGGAQATITNDLIDMASNKLKDFTPDAVDNIIDDLSANFKK
jgi:hypothetical protein